MAQLKLSICLHPQQPLLQETLEEAGLTILRDIISVKEDFD